tara:strand:- start:986 stop:1324 length:339 start_codon:yes stop_codon:yes gene_type:complete
VHTFLRAIFKMIREQPLFFLSIIVLSSILGATQYQFWYGDYSKSNLAELKEEIALVQIESNLIKMANEELVNEKKKLNSGKEALEGVARQELGMVKPGEKFYVFKEATKKKP